MTRPPALTEQVSRQMSRMPRTGTGPEMALRRELHRRGLRFTLRQKGLPARPDVVFSRARVAVFVDGCFWHRCPVHGTSPKNNGEWWREKLDGNVARDRRQDAALAEMGWLVLRFWEHEEPVAAADAVAEAWSSRTGASPSFRRTRVASLG